MSGCYCQVHYPELDWLSGNKKHEHPWNLFITNSHNNSYHHSPSQFHHIIAFLTVLNRSLFSTVSYHHSPPQFNHIVTLLHRSLFYTVSYHHTPTHVHPIIILLHGFITSSLYSIVSSYHHSPPHIIK